MNITSFDSALHRLQRMLVALFLLLIGTAVLILLPHLVSHGLSHLHDAALVVAVNPGGQVQRVSLPSGFQARSLVETDQGFFVIHGSMSLGKHETVWIQQRANADRFLCSARQTHCVAMD